MLALRSTLPKLPFDGLPALTRINPANGTFIAVFRNRNRILKGPGEQQGYTEITFL